jgi:hypothetical protein
MKQLSSAAAAIGRDAKVIIDPDICLLYSCGQSGKTSIPRVMMSKSNAETWCGSDLSKGTLHGHRWMYMFTSLANYVGHYGLGEREIKIVDDGRFDKRFEKAGVRKFSQNQIKRIADKYGLRIRVKE